MHYLAAVLQQLELANSCSQFRAGSGPKEIVRDSLHTTLFQKLGEITSMCVSIFMPALEDYLKHVVYELHFFLFLIARASASRVNFSEPTNEIYFLSWNQPVLRTFS